MAKPNQKERFKNIVASLAEAVETDGFRVFLEHFAKVMKRLSRYSVRNVTLILGQRRDVTDVRGFRAWKKVGRSVRKGEKAIYIWAPRYKKIAKEEDGEEDEPLVLAGFTMVPVFDVSQTDGDEPPDNPQYSIKNPTNLELSAIEAAISQNIAPVLHTPGLDTLGTYSPVENVIEIRNGLPEPVAIHTLFHEAAHALLHKDDRLDPKQEELEAETTAFIISNILGLDAKLASATYLVNYGANPEKLYSLLNRVGEAARRILEVVEQQEPAKAA